jgi:hypothetical protein
MAARLHTKADIEAVVPEDNLFFMIFCRLWGRNGNKVEVALRKILAEMR